MTKCRIAAVNGLFNRVRQVEPMCTLVHMFHWTHPSPRLKRHLERFSRFCTAYGRVWATHSTPQNCPFPRGSGPHLIHGSLAHPSPHHKRHLNRFSGFCRAHDRDRPTVGRTDHAIASSVTVCSINVRSTAIRPKMQDNANLTRRFLQRAAMLAWQALY